MARLNEPPVSTDSFETLRRKLLRQNRDLAKLNNVRALRIRELENECACMLSQNCELRGKIIELEKQVENNETRRIADHALNIKAKLESQLTEWGSLIAELGLEPPPKRHSPSIRKSTTKRRTTFNPNRLSPSQRRLRDVAKEIEELGHISEHKSYPRMSMNPEQILALRNEADSADEPDVPNSPELGPPPMSQFVDDEPVKMESPVAASPKYLSPSPKGKLEPPEALHSPQADQVVEASPLPQKSPSPEKKKDVPIIEPQEEPREEPWEEPKEEPKEELQEVPKKRFEPKSHKFIISDSPSATPTKAGTKRKFASHEGTENIKPLNNKTNENKPLRVLGGKQSSIRDKTGGKTLKELSNIRKEERPTVSANRKPLSSKSTNDDVASPKKKSRPTPVDDVTAAKADISKPKMKPLRDVPRAKSKNAAAKPTATEPKPEPKREPAVQADTADSDLGQPLAEPELLAPNSPEPTPAADAARGDTPPPADISSKGETSRASRRSRGVVSYAEPNLRDKMRRPTKDMVDAVTGARRSSQFGLPESQESNKVKRESSFEGFLDQSENPGPASPLAGKGPSAAQQSMVTDHRKRSSAAAVTEQMRMEESVKDESTESIPMSDIDVYDVAAASPQPKQSKRKGASRGTKSSRRFSSAMDNDDNYIAPERPSSRRRSMMV